jgi:cystathionine beta-synthase
MNGNIDAMVVGVGSGGTLTGLGRYLKSKSAKLEMVLADPKGSILDHLHKTGEMKSAGSWLVEGIGEDFVPSICDMSLVDQSYEIPDHEALMSGRELLRLEGIMGGSSTGTLLAAALRYCRAQKTPKRIVTFVCDTGTRYVSKMYNDEWMSSQGLL